jgi:tetratricopeptide (TPR) repeat protein
MFAGRLAPLAFMAMLAHHQGDLSSALTLSQEALAVAQELNFKQEQASASMNAGYILLRLARIDEASEFLQKALELWQELGESKMLAETKSALARTCLAGAKSARALELVEEVMATLTGGPHIDPKNIREMAFSSLEGMDEPFDALLNSYLVLDLFKLRGRTTSPLTPPVIRTAWIEDGLNESFLNNIPLTNK